MKLKQSPLFGRQCLFFTTLLSLNLLAAMQSPAQVAITPLGGFGGADGWLTPGEGGYTYLGTSSLEQGMAYGNNHLYLVSRNGGDNIRILDKLTGADLGALPLGSGIISGGTFTVNTVGVGQDGAIYVANLCTPVNGATPFKIYRWADESATPTVAFSSTSITAGQLGTDLDVFGGGAATRLIAGEYTGGGSGLRNSFAVLTTSDGLSFNGSLAPFVATQPTAGDFALGLTFLDSTHVFGAKKSVAPNDPVRYVSITAPLATITGQWDFDAGDLSATIGNPLQYRGTTAGLTQFGTTTSFGIADIGGQAADVMRFPACSSAQGYLMQHGGAPNASPSGTKVNQYTVIMDILYPSTSTGFRSFWQTETNNPLTTDGDFFVNGANAIGISGQYQGNLTPNVWHRVAFTVDLTTRELGKYIDGINVLTGPVGVAPLGSKPMQYLPTAEAVADGRWSLGPLAMLFTDQDNETGVGYVNSIQFQDRVLSAAEIAALGGSAASGIPNATPATPAGIGKILATPVLATSSDAPMDYAVVNGLPVLATVSLTDSRVRVYDASNPANLLLLATSSATLANPNSLDAGAVAWGDQVDNGDGTHTAYLYAMNANNGIQAFTVTVGPGTPAMVAQQAYLKASNTGAIDQFGGAVAISGDTVVVGAISESSNATGVDGDGSDNSAANSGAAYVLVRNGGTWTQQAYLKASNTEANDVFGRSVAISGDTIVVGANNEDSNATGVDGNQSNNSALASGAAYVFVRSGTTWTQQAYLKASNTGNNDFFGTAVAISGDTIAVAAHQESSNATGVNGDQTDNSALRSGAVYVFVRSGTVWTQQAYLKASNTAGDDFFGVSIGLSGDTLVVGAYLEDSNATGVDGNQNDNSASSAGAAYVFVRNGTTWSQEAYLKASNTGADDSFGGSVAVSGDTVVVGAGGEDSNATGVNGNQNDNSAALAGATYVFVRNGTTWTQQAYLKASNTGADDVFAGVAISGDAIVVTANREDSNATGVDGNQGNNSATDSGAAYLFTRTGTTWTQQAYLKASNTGANDAFGYSRAVAGDNIVVGAIGESSNATGVNGDQSNNSANAAGAVYVFTIATNQAPDVSNPIADTNGVYGAPFVFTFPANTFSNPDPGQSFTYSAVGMPQGIYFSPGLRTFHGTPSQSGIFPIIVTATDNGTPQLSTNDLFEISIAKVPLSVTASNASRLYGDAPPYFVGNITGETNGDIFSLTFNCAADFSTPIGNYAIVPEIHDNGNRLVNYTITTNEGTLTVSNALLTVTASDATCTFGAPIPALTGSLVGLRNGDNITASFETTATNTLLFPLQPPPPGQFPIALLSLNDPDAKLSNYTVSTNNGTLTIDQPAMAVFNTNQILAITWPGVPTNSQLKVTTNFHPPVIWHPVTFGITEVNGTKLFIVTNDLREAGRMFRVEFPWPP